MNKLDIQKFNLNLEDNIFQLNSELKNRVYRHENYISFFVRDPKLRKIHKATVKDRVLHHAIFRVLYPIFDKTFIADSYSCRNGKGTHRAVNRLQKFFWGVSKNNTKTCFVLQCDIRKFFDSVSQQILLDLVKKKIKDEKALWLIGQIVGSFALLPDRGLPLGNITSQLFANIYLNEFDQFIKHQLRVRYYTRYCDDFVILSDKKEYLEHLVIEISEFLEKKLSLFLHKEKVLIKKYHQGVDFLGYVSFPYFRILRTKTKRRMFVGLRMKQEQIWNNEISEVSFNQSLQSYLGILKHCNGYKLQKLLLQETARFGKMNLYAENKG